MFISNGIITTREAQAMRDTPGYVDTDRRFLMLAEGHADPDTDCDLEFGDERFSIFRWSKDPCSAYFDLHVRYKGAAA